MPSIAYLDFLFLFFTLTSIPLISISMNIWLQDKVSSLLYSEKSIVKTTSEAVYQPLRIFP